MKKERKLLGKTIGSLRRHIRTIQKKRYAEYAEVKLTVDEFILLAVVERHKKQILQQIATITGKNKSAAMRMVDSLEKKQLLRREVNPDDRRENFLILTAEGEGVVENYRKIEETLTKELVAGIPEADVETFFRVAQQIQKNAGNM